MPKVLTACSSMVAKLWLNDDTRIEIKMSFNIQTGAVVAGYRQVLPEYTGWRGWVGTWQWLPEVGGLPEVLHGPLLLVMLPGIPVLVLSRDMVRMGTTVISQSQLMPATARFILISSRTKRYPCKLSPVFVY